MRARARIASGLVLGLSLWGARPCAAQTEAARTQATTEFAKGSRAFRAGDFREAARAFEEADRLAPHPNALWNAARSWHRAGVPARAANLYARYLELPPDSAPDRARATEALAELNRTVAQIAIVAPKGAEIWVDDEPVTQRNVYVNPGSHVVRAKAGTREQTITVDAAAGRTVSAVALADEPARAEASPSPPPRPEHRAPPAPSRGLSPAFVYVGAGATLLATGATVWLGVVTNEARDRFDADPTQDRLDHGRHLQSITNVGLGVSLGLAAATTATAIFLVRWKDSGSAALGIGPTGAEILGKF